MKDSVKEKALNNVLHFVEFDLKAVKYCSSIKAKAIFYKWKLAGNNMQCGNKKCYLLHMA
jgi:hypothetical protein